MNQDKEETGFRKLGTLIDPLSFLNIFSFERNVVPLWWITESPHFSKQSLIVQNKTNNEIFLLLGFFFTYSYVLPE